MSRIYYAHLLMILHRQDEALIQGQLAVVLDPLNPLVLALYSVVLRSEGLHQKAYLYAEKAITINPEHGFATGQIKLALNYLGEYEKAFEYRKKVLSKFFREELIQSFDLIYKEQGYRATDKEIVRQFEILAQERYVSSNVLARRHYMNRQYSKALDDLERGYEMHESNMPYLATGDNGYVELYDSTRFIAILRKMNLPLPKN